VSCNCHGHSLPPQHVGNGMMAIVKKKPCGPCAQAAAAIASTIPESEGGTMKVAGAPDDLFVIQSFLQTLTSGVAPTQPALAQAQTAADNLSVTLAVQQAMPQPKPLSIGLMVLGALAVGAGTAYLLSSPRSRR